MEKPGYSHEDSQGSGKGQKLKIGPASEPTAAKPGAAKALTSGKGVLSYLKDHRRGAALTLAGLFVAASAMQSEREHPQHSLASMPGATYAAARVFHNLSSIVDSLWGAASAVGGPSLEKAGLVGSGTQPSTRFIVCTNKTLLDQMKAGNPRATAYGKAIQKQLDLQSYYQLAVKDGAFYRQNEHVDPETLAPVAIFHMTPASGLDSHGVPYSWNPNVPVNLALPDAVAQKNAGPAACDKDEVFRWSPVPGMKANKL